VAFEKGPDYNLVGALFCNLVSRKTRLREAIALNEKRHATANSHTIYVLYRTIRISQTIILKKQNFGKHTVL
jgi:hypothetical protein